MPVSRKVAVTVVAVAVATLSLMLASNSSAPLVAQQSYERPNLPPPGPELDRARETVTFEIPMPRTLPQGAELLNVVYTAPGLGQPDHSSYSTVDIWYALPDGRRLHVWLTDRQDLEERGRAPHQEARSRPVELGNGTWYETVLTDREPDATVLARTVGRVTVTLDVQGEAKGLRAMAASY